MRLCFILVSARVCRQRFGSQNKLVVYLLPITSPNDNEDIQVSGVDAFEVELCETALMAVPCCPLGTFSLELVQAAVELLCGACCCAWYG